MRTERCALRCGGRFSTGFWTVSSNRANGWLKRRFRRNFKLAARPVSECDLTELYSIRTALEKFAFTLAWSLRTPDALADFDRRYDELMSIRATGDQAKAIKREIAFHSWVYGLPSTGYYRIIGRDCHTWCAST